MLVEGQIVGAAAQGIGGALLEEFVYDDAGQPLVTSFADYLMPTSAETPAVEMLLREDAPSPLNPLGVKGAGEGGITAVGAAIAAAIDDALAVPRRRRHPAHHAQPPPRAVRRRRHSSYQHRCAWSAPHSRLRFNQSVRTLLVSVVAKAVLRRTRIIGDQIAGPELIGDAVDLHGQRSLQDEAIFEALVRHRLFGIARMRLVFVESDRDAVVAVLLQQTPHHGVPASR